MIANRTFETWVECDWCDGNLYPGRYWNYCSQCGRFRHIKSANLSQTTVSAKAASHPHPIETTFGWLHLHKLACLLSLTLGNCARCKRQIEQGHLCVSCRLEMLCQQIRHHHPLHSSK